MKKNSWVFVIIILAIFLLSAYLLYPFLNEKSTNEYIEITAPYKLSNPNTHLIEDENGTVYLSGPSSNMHYWYIYQIESGTLSKEYKISIENYTHDTHTTYGSCICKTKVFISIGEYFIIYDLHNERIIKALDLRNFQLAYPSTDQIVCSNSTIVLNLFIENNITQNNTKAKLGVYNITNGKMNYIVLEKGALLVAVSPNGKYITYLQSMPWKRENNTEMAETLITKINVTQNKTETYNISKYLELREATPIGDLKVKNDGRITAIVETLNSQVYIKIGKENKIIAMPINLKTNHVCLYNNSIFSVVNNTIREYNESGEIVHIYRFSTEKYFYCDILTNEKSIYLFLLGDTEKVGKIIVYAK